MKKIMTKTLTLLLAVVMVLGVLPFASAAVEAEITCNKDAVWPGQTVALTLKVSEGTGLNGVSWSDGISGSSNQVSYKVPEDATGSVTVSATAVTNASPSNPEGEPVSASITLDVLEPAGEDFSITGGASTAMVGEPVTFSTDGENDAFVSWSVEGGDASINSSGRFKANAEGTYTITATATNGGAFGPVTDSTTITVTGADYTVTMKDREVALSSGTTVMTYTVTPEPENCTVSFSSSNTAVATIDDNGVATLNKKGESVITVTVTIDGVAYKDEAVLTVEDEGAITCAQNGKENGGSSVTMVFKLNGVTATDVDWDINVGGDGEFEVSDKTTNGTTASVTIECEDIGVAEVDVSAKWGSDGEASDTFYTSFYQSINVKAVLDEDVEKFDFDKTGIFSQVSGTNNPTKQSMYNFLTDGVATRVILTEESSGNSRVGVISCDNASYFKQYDPDDTNDYSLTELEDLSFRVKGEGTYRLDYELYSMMGGGLATTKGTIQLIVGEGVGSDIEYTTMTGGSVNFKADDFEEFWEDNGEDGEDLKYVTFDVATSTSMAGSLYTNKGKDLVKTAWKFYLNGKSGNYDLSDVTYQAIKGNKGYEDSVGFTCYGEDGSKATGVVLITVNNGKLAFTDVKTTDWFYDEVQYVYSQGIMNGTSDSKFEPNGTLNRAMVVTMLYRVAGSPATAASGTFSDVPSGQWYTEAVEWAAKNNIVNGVGNGKFAPTSAITREQLAAILYRYAKYDGMNVSDQENLNSFSDAAKVSEYAETALQWAVAEGIITGADGKLMPQGSATRAQAAAMFSRFMKLDSGSSKNDRDDDVTVYVSGTKYHYDEDCAGRNAKEKDLEDVEDDYKPCSKCVD